MPPLEKKDPSDLAQKIIQLANLLHDKKARDIHALDVSIYNSAFEGLLIATAEGERHARSLADHLLELVHSSQWDFLGMEGYQQGEWILLDLNDILVHIFLEEARRFYNLEGFWSRGGQMDLQLPEQGNV